MPACAPAFGTDSRVGVSIAVYTAVGRLGGEARRHSAARSSTGSARSCASLVLAPGGAGPIAPAIARLWRAHRSRVTGIAVLSPLSYILILIAMRHGAVSHIAPARELSILIGTWLGGRVLGEGGRDAPPGRGGRVCRRRDRAGLDLRKRRC